MSINVSRGQKSGLARKIRFRRHISGSVPRVSGFRPGCDVPVQASNPNHGHNRAVGNSIVVSSVSGPRKGSTTRLPEQTLDPSHGREASRWSATLVTEGSWDSCSLWTIPPNHGQREQDLGLSSPWRTAITPNIQVFACPRVSVMSERHTPHDRRTARTPHCLVGVGLRRSRA